MTSFLRHSCPEPWEDPKNGSTSGLYNPHHRNIRVQNWGFHATLHYTIRYHTLLESKIGVLFFVYPPRALGERARCAE